MPRPPSRAAKSLARRLQDAGLRADARRVQTLTTVGLIAAPEPGFPGGGGSEGTYTDSSFEQAKEAIELDDKHPRARYRAAMEMFGRHNFTVAEAKLKRSMLSAIKRLESEIRAAGSDQSPPEEVASLAGPILARRIAANPATRDDRRRLKRGEEPRSERLSLAMSDMAMIFLAGEILSPLEIEHLFDLAGASQVHAMWPLTDKPLDPAAFTDFYEAMSIESLKNALAACDLGLIEDCREDFLTISTCARTSLDLLPRLGGPRPPAQLPAIGSPNGLEIANSAVLMLALRAGIPEKYKAKMCAVRKYASFLRALDLLASRLDPRFHSMMLQTTKTVRDIDPDFLAEMEKVMPDFEREHPDELHVLRYTFPKT